LIRGKVAACRSPSTNRKPNPKKESAISLKTLSLVSRKQSELSRRRSAIPVRVAVSNGKGQDATANVAG
jgi:hypothetical protein